MMMRYLRPVLIGLAILCTATNLAAKSDAADGGYYTNADKEFYLTADEIYFIRPGLELEVLDVVIPADMRPLVTFSMKDPGGLPLDINGVYTPGPVDMRYMLTYIPMGEEQKVKLTEGSRDADGVTTPLGDGVYTYQFGTVLGDSYQADATHILGLVGRRDLREWDLDRYVDNEIYNFVPSGMYDPVGRDIVTTETCNRCHDPLAMHGGRYQEIGICTQCHNPGLFGRDDPTASRSMNVIIHQVHSFGDLETPLIIGRHDYTDGALPAGANVNDCELCHTGGTPTENFPVVANPSPVPICDASGRGITTLSWEREGGVDIRVGSKTGPRFAKTFKNLSKDTGKWVKNGTEFVVLDPTSGDVIQNLHVKTTTFGCSGNAPYAPRGVAGTQHTNWLDHPSRLVCGSCHDHVDFATGEGHSSSGIAQDNDDSCGNCHKPDSGNEYDSSIRGAHQVIFKSSQLSGVILEFIDIVDTNPGDKPTVTFSLMSRDGIMNPDNTDRIRFVIVGPNEDYSYRNQETVGDSARRVGPFWEYTFENPLPEDAMGSFTISVEGRHDRVVDMGDESEEEHDTIEATLMPFIVTGDELVPRRVVVSDEKCESCHANLAGHGHGRTNVDYCSTCHLPDVVAQLEPQESWAMKFMTHKIHRGADLENGYVVVRSRGIYDFSHVEYPGDLRNCAACHVNGSENLPLSDGLIATLTPKNFWPVMEPVAAACLSCHDTDSAAAHAYSNTTFFGEACSTCHGEGMDFAVSKVHAR